AQDYTKAATDYNTKTEDLTKKIAGLPDPASAIKNVKLGFDENAAKGGAPLDPMTKKVLDGMERDVLLPKGQKVGPKGQCVDLVQSLRPDVGNTSTWKASTSDKVIGGTAPAPLTPIATMFKKSGSQDLWYPSQASGNHAAMYVDQGSDAQGRN